MESPTRPAQFLCLIVQPSVELSPIWDETVSELEKRLPDMIFERVDSANLFTTKSESVSLVGQDTIDSYLEFRKTADYDKLRFVSLKMLNRYDLSGTFRLIDREALFVSHLLKAFHFLLARRPSRVVFEVTPHEFAEYLIYGVCQWMNIPAVFFQPCPLAQTMLIRSSLSESEPPGIASVRNSNSFKFISAQLNQNIAGLLRGDIPSYIRAQALKEKRAASRVRRPAVAWATFRRIFQDPFPQSIDFGGHHRPSRFHWRVLKMFLIWSLQRSLRIHFQEISVPPSPKSDYCVFALHYEPERTSLPEGLPFDFQADSVLAARAFAPKSVSLVVKEHSSQLSPALRGHLGRSKLFYELLSLVEGIQFAGEGVDLRELASNSQCVFTMTGTVAIESVFRGIPVVYFGRPWWEGLPGTARFDSLSRFSDVEGIRVPPPEEIQGFLENLILDHMIPGFPLGSSQFGPKSALPEAYESSVCDSLVSFLANHFKT